MGKQIRPVTIGLLLLLTISLISINPVLADDGSSNGSTGRGSSITPIFTFNSYIDIVPDTTPLNEPLAIDQSVNVPLTIQYSTDVPPNFLGFLGSSIKNLIIFGSVVAPRQKISLEVINKPTWADINIADKDILVDIPFKGSPSTRETTLVLSPYEEAPAQPYTITIRASCERIGRVNGFNISSDIVFTPSFVPTISITPENPTRTVGPREIVNFKIIVKNEANKKTRVIPDIVGNHKGWNPTINPPFHDIPSGGEATFVFSVYSPYNFGWHNDIETFQIDFTAQIFPIRKDAPVGGPYSIYLRVNNYGFSVPGFELVVFTIALVGVAFIIKRRSH
ncbi:MAG: hypothetical protein DRN12_01885 [Thermoplasmata archaeon]|nr:MAG: hypothetical protein DRN12_01885 [Thermoplasmata archaeon]